MMPLSRLHGPVVVHQCPFIPCGLPVFGVRLAGSLRAAVLLLKYTWLFIQAWLPSMPWR